MCSYDQLYNFEEKENGGNEVDDFESEEPAVDKDSNADPGAPVAVSQREPANLAPYGQASADPVNWQGAS